MMLINIVFCKHYGFKLTTMDQDFKNVKDIEIVFL